MCARLRMRQASGVGGVGVSGTAGSTDWRNRLRIRLRVALVDSRRGRCATGYASRASSCAWTTVRPTQLT